MSTVAPKPPAAPRPSPSAAMVDSEGFIDEHIRRTRRSLKLVDLSAGLLSLAVTVLGYLLAAAMLDQWVFTGGLGTAGRLALFGALLVVVSWHVVRHFLPLLRPINPVYAAATIERNSPSLKNSLLNVLLFRTHRQQMSAKVYHALEQQAAQRLSISAGEASIDHTALLRLGYALLAIVAVCAIYSVLSPKNLAVSAARILAPWTDLPAPTRVKILEVQPGDTSVARGERLTVSAEIHGARADEPVKLRYSTADEQAVDESIVMTRPTDGLRFEAQLPRPADAGGAVGVMQNLEYWLEAGDAHSRRFKVSVFDRPTLVVERVRYEFPAYTGIPSAEAAGSGDLRGVEGTRVTLRAIASQPIKSAAIDFDADGTSDLAMSVEGEKADRAVASFVLALRDDRRTPAHPNYVLRLETTSGRKNADPAQYRIEVTPDYAPEVRITRPEEPETTARVDETVLIGVEARDPDFALAGLRLVGKAGERDVLVGDLMPDGRNQEGRVGAMKPFTPADVLLKPGDVLEYWAEARDNRRPEPNVSVSERRRLKIVGAPNGEKGAPGNRQQDQPDRQQPGDGAPQDGQQAGGQQAGGQQQGGEPQNGEQGEGQPGEQGVAGGKREGQQSDQPQEGQSAPGGAGDSGGDSAEKNPAAGGQGGEQSDSPQDPAAQPNDAGANQQQSASGGEANPGANQPQGGAPNAPSKVSPEGEADGDAIERMQEHFAQQDANNQQGNQQQGDQQQAGKQRAGDQQQSGDAQQTDQKAATGGRAADQNAAQQNSAQQAGDQPQAAGEAQQKPDEKSASPNPDGARNGQPKASAGESGEPQPSGAGKAQPQAGAQDPNQRRAADKAQQGKTGDGNTGQERDGEKPAPDSVANQNQGNAGSGSASEEDSGAPGDENSARQARDKKDADNRRSKGDQEAPSGSPDKRESDSRGSTGGDASGGGQEGSGQHADAQGKGEAGQHEAADQGAGKAAEQGDGETGDQAGDQQLADGKAGESSGDKPGQGSESRESEDASENDANNKAATGGRADDQKTNQSQGGEPGDQPGNESGEQAGDQPGKQSGDKSEGTSGEQAGDQAGEQSGKDKGEEQDGQQSGEQAGQQARQQARAKGDASSKPSPNDSGDSSSQGAASSSPPQGGGTNSGINAAGAEPPTAEEIADKANLDFARQQTDLVLERLDDQLAKKKVDPKLLKSLGWSEDELRRFVERWAGLKSRADAQDPEAQRELDAALRSLGLRRSGPLRFRADAKDDKLHDLKEGYRTRAPLEYSERVRAYVKGAAGGESSSEDAK